MDADMAAELTDHLFQQDDEKFGLDLVQFNVNYQHNFKSANNEKYRNKCQYWSKQQSSCFNYSHEHNSISQKEIFTIRKRLLL